MSSSINDPSRDHPLRRLLNDEVHARPSLRASTPSRITHFALMTGEGEAPPDRDPLAELCTLAGSRPPALDARYALVELDGVTVKYERHTEFVSVTVIAPDKDDSAADRGGWSALTPALAEWAFRLPGVRLVAVNLRLERDTETRLSPDDLARVFVGEVVGSYVNGGDAVVWTDFKIASDGYTRWLVRDIALTEARAGRLIQRLLEIETYRMAALLALPLARDQAGRLAALERRLSEIVQVTVGADSPRQEHDLLDQLTKLAAEAEGQLNSSRYRFNASAAYADLVERRILELREERIEGLQRIGVFLDRRFRPAMRTCETVARRQADLVEGIARASSMLRTRVDVMQAEQNAMLLRSMDARTAAQLRMQEAVEGLSIFAITYYVVGLAKYVLEGAGGIGLHFDKGLAISIVVPSVLAYVWWKVRRLRRRIRKTEGSGS